MCFALGTYIVVFIMYMIVILFFFCTQLPEPEAQGHSRGAVQNHERVRAGREHTDGPRSEQSLHFVCVIF